MKTPGERMPRSNALSHAKSACPTSDQRLGDAVDTGRRLPFGSRGDAADGPHEPRDRKPSGNLRNLRVHRVPRAHCRVRPLRGLSPLPETLSAFSPDRKIAVSDDLVLAKVTPTRGVSRAGTVKLTLNGQAPPPIRR